MCILYTHSLKEMTILKSTETGFMIFYNMSLTHLGNSLDIVTL